MSYKWPGIPNGDYSFDHGRAVWNRIINFLRRLCEKLDGDLVDATSDRRGLMTAEDKAAFDAIPETYETQEHAAATYETQDHAAATYETKTHASVTYAVKYGSLTDDPIVRTSQSGREANIINIGSDLTNPDTSETFDLGWNYVNRDGALLGLRSSSYSTEPGYFKLYARDEDNQSILQGTPNGELTWRDNQVITLVDTATTTKNGVMTAADKIKLDGISAGAEVNQKAFATVLVDNINVAADTKSDTLTLVAGNNITLTADATNNKITIAAKDTVTTVSTTGNGNAVTSITASNGALTVKKDSTFSLSNHTHSSVSWPRVPANGFVDVVSLYDADATSNRTGTIRISNGNGYHEMLLGVHNEANGWPEGFWIRNTAGTLTCGISGNIQANSFNGYILDLNTNNTTDSWVPVLNSSKLQHRVIPVKKDRNFTKNNTYVSTAYMSTTNVISGTYLSFTVNIKNMSSKWTDYKIGTIGSGSSAVSRSIFVDQRAAIAVPFRVDTNGEVYVEVKNVLPENNGWLWGGIFIPNA